MDAVAKCLEYVVSPPQRPVGPRHPSPKTAVPPILNLPCEIILEIMCYLPGYENILLGLTCRSLHNIVNENEHSTALSLRDRRNLLQTIHKDTPRLHYCDECLMLHPFNPKTGPFWWTDRAAYGVCENFREAFCGVGTGYNFDYSLSFRHAKLVMDIHCLSPKHGIPLDALAGEVSGVRSYTTHQVWRPRIIKNELFLSATHELSHSGSTSELRHALDYHPFSICAHVFTHSRSYGLKIPQVRRCRCAPDCPHMFVECKDILGSCPYCLTDYETSIVRDEAPKTKARKTRIIIVTYHRLGPCRSRDEWEWQALITNQYKLESENMSNRTMQGYERGDIKREWESWAVSEE